MMDRNNNINKTQNLLLLVNTVIGVGVLNLPSVLAAEVGSSGWISLIIAGIILMILVVIMTKVAARYERKTLVEFGKDLLPTPIANLISFIFFLHILSAGALVLRIFMEVIRVYLLNATPIQVIGITIVIVCAHSVRSGIESMARIFTLVTPVIFVPVIFVILVVAVDINFSNYFPLFDVSIKDIISSISKILLSISGFEMIYIFTPFIKDDKKDLLKYNLWAVVIVIAFNLVIYLLTLGKYGKELLESQIWPFMSLMRSVKIPSAFIENIDGIMITIWILIMFTTLSAILFTSSLTISRLFKAKSEKPFVIPIMLLIYFLSTVPQNISEVYEYTDLYTGTLDRITIFVIPIVFILVMWFKKKWRTQYDK
ncbi:spore germination protein A2 [Gottschalkia purinilytica]|uniref:Spore germination protein A2 n=1 Tax=Gottschalkia purinilytica TaxID=1503 RepID=A0A0L0WE84_GOTPU|nr:endospore germination permease [Gottschalkia purinilytica]KNF09779.1 spore germination protein A2 [Gottschalkia purinilytica]